MNLGEAPSGAPGVKPEKGRDMQQEIAEIDQLFVDNLHDVAQKLVDTAVGGDRAAQVYILDKIYGLKGRATPPRTLPTLKEAVKPSGNGDKGASTAEGEVTRPTDEELNGMWKDLIDKTKPQPKQEEKVAGTNGT